MIYNVKRALVLISAFALAACDDGSGGTVNIFDDIATVSGGGRQSSEQRALSNEERKYAQARLTGAGLGGAAALGVCLLSNCSSEQRAAAVVLGATAGYVGGAALTRENKSFKVSQASLNRDLQLAKQERQGLKSAADSADRVVAYQRQEIARLNAGLRNGTVTRDQYRASYRSMQGDLKATQSLISTGNKRVSGLNNSIRAHKSAGLNTSQLSSERSAQARELERLRRAERNITNALRTVPAEVRSTS